MPGSPADRAGIRNGDRILAFEGEEVASPEALVVLVSAMRPGDEAQLTVLRDEEILPMRIVLGSTVNAPHDERAPDSPEPVDR